MARAKAKYSGQKLRGETPSNFSEDLKQLLRKFYPDKNAAEDPTWGHPADDFVLQILAEAHFAISMLFQMQADTTTEEIRLECSDLLSALKSAEQRLRKISPDLDRIISADAAPLDCADQIAQMTNFIEKAAILTHKLPKAQRRDSRVHEIAVELSIRVLRVLNDFGISPSEYVSTDHVNSPQSDAVKILHAIGRDIGINKVPTTWRDIIGEAKEQACDLRSI